MTDKNLCWTTESEINYLQNAGNFHPEHGKSKIDFLVGYIKAAKNRVSWSGISRPKVMARAKELLLIEMS